MEQQDTITMTLERFGGSDRAGVRVLVLEGEDEEEVVCAWGHIDRDEMEAAERERWRVWGWTDEQLATFDKIVDRVEHVWAIVTGQWDDGRWVINWQGVSAATPGAFPITFAVPA